MLLLSFAGFFSKIIFSKSSFRNTINVSNGLDTDQDPQYIRPDLGQNCLQKLSADNKICRYLAFFKHRHMTLCSKARCQINAGSNHPLPSVCHLRRLL